MFEPGAKTSTQSPKFEKDERASAIVEAPTVTALGVLAGVLEQASVFSFPAATTGVMPAAKSFCTASFTNWYLLPPRLAFITPGVPAG
jgi:hypothetical protein